MAQVVIGPMPLKEYRANPFYRWAYVLAAGSDGSWYRVKDFGYDEHSFCPSTLHRDDFQDLIVRAVKDDEARELFTIKGGETWMIFLKWLGLEDDPRYFDIPYYDGCEILY